MRIVGDCLEVLRDLGNGSVQMCVTSPPYWGLRSYGIGRKNGELGLEPTPEEYVAKMVEVFRLVRDVLSEDGVLFLNLGDSYATGAGSVGNSPGGGKQGAQWSGPMTQPNRMPIAGLKPKDLCGMPWRVAFALQADGWWLRSDIIWAKKNPMPESVRDRPTRAHEYLFLLTKNPRYYYDAEAVREPDVTKPQRWISKGIDDRRVPGQQPQSPGMSQRQANGLGAGRNRRTVWTIAEPMYKLRSDITPEQRAFVLRRIADVGCP